MGTKGNNRNHSVELHNITSETCVNKHQLSTPKGAVTVKWQTKHQSTALGQLPFFIEFLHRTELFANWLSDCPLSYRSPNASKSVDVLGTWLLSILSGHQRYAHVTNIRSDGVNPELLNMSKVISEDSLRRALSNMVNTGKSDDWMQSHLKQSTNDLLDDSWILDVDTSIKPIYGKQEGAVVSYNPTKKGRPSHCYHTYLIARYRLVLDVALLAGNEHMSNHDILPLQRLLSGLDANKRPKLVRGDCGFGNAPVMRMLEAQHQAYLFKLKQSKQVKQLTRYVFNQDGWVDMANSSWQGIESQLKLSTWKQARRVIVFRRPIKDDLVVVQDDDKQQVFGFMGESYSDVKAYEYAVLVTNSQLTIPELFQCYRDRADAENIFDELKNHWGWGGFTTQDIARCQLSAQAVALIYNWWSLFVRLANPTQHQEAITSKPLLLQAIGRQTKHANKTTITIAPLHAKKDKAIQWLNCISRRLKQYQANAEQLKISVLKQCWLFIKQHYPIEQLNNENLNC